VSAKLPRKALGVSICKAAQCYAEGRGRGKSPKEQWKLRGGARVQRSKLMNEEDKRHQLLLDNATWGVWNGAPHEGHGERLERGKAFPKRADVPVLQARNEFHASCGGVPVWERRGSNGVGVHGGRKKAV